MSAQTNSLTVTWRLREIVAGGPNASHGVLAAALAKDGAHPISRSQVCRLLNAAPQQVPVALIGALCRILQVSPNELLGWVPSQPSNNSGLQQIRQRGRQAATQCKIAQRGAPDAKRLDAPDGERANIVGPRVRAMPTHPLARAKDVAK